jgi:hypothetical protein
VEMEKTGYPYGPPRLEVTPNQNCRQNPNLQLQ